MTTKTILITGASRGLGLALAREMARQGWNLIINGREKKPLALAQEELARQTTVIALPGDIAEPGHRQKLAAAAAELGGLDALVNNAGMLGPSPQPTLLDYPLETLTEVYKINVIAQLGVLQAVHRQLKPGAAVLNITSDAAVEPYEGWGGYGSSKAALEQLTRILAAENQAWRIYTVDPGDMQTRMHQEAFPGEDISDRGLPEDSVPGLVALIKSHRPSGRYKAREEQLIVNN